MTTNTCPAKKPALQSRASSPAVEFRFDEIDLRSPAEAAPGETASINGAAIEHLVQLASGEIATVVGANAYQPEGPMTTFFSTGSSRGTIDSWSVRIASYRTNDIVSIQRSVSGPTEHRQPRPNLVAA